MLKRLMNLLSPKPKPCEHLHERWYKIAGSGGLMRYISQCTECKALVQWRSHRPDGHVMSGKWYPSKDGVTMLRVKGKNRG